MFLCRKKTEHTPTPPPKSHKPRGNTMHNEKTWFLKIVKNGVMFLQMNSSYIIYKYIFLYIIYKYVF